MSRFKCSASFGLSFGSEAVSSWVVALRGPGFMEHSYSWANQLLALSQSQESTSCWLQTLFSCIYFGNPDSFRVAALQLDFLYVLHKKTGYIKIKEADVFLSNSLGSSVSPGLMMAVMLLVEIWLTECNGGILCLALLFLILKWKHGVKAVKRLNGEVLPVASIRLAKQESSLLIFTAPSHFGEGEIAELCSTRSCTVNPLGINILAL